MSESSSFTRTRKVTQQLIIKILQGDVTLDVVNAMVRKFGVKVWNSQKFSVRAEKVLELKLGKENSFYNIESTFLESVQPKTK